MAPNDDSAVKSTGARNAVGSVGRRLRSHFKSQNDTEVVDSVDERDREVLAALGYKQEFKRDFTWVESFAVSFSVLGLLPSIGSTLSDNLAISGLAGSVWGWIVAGLLIQSVVFGLAELCSSMPTAGGLYYATAVLAPDGWGPFASWVIGWSTTLGFVMGPCSVNYAMASMILAAVRISNPEYEIQEWHLYSVFVVLLCLEGLFAMISTKLLGYVNIVGTIVNMSALLIFIFWLPTGSVNTPKFNDNETVWINMQNGTEWPIGWAFVMGFLSVIWTMSGFDTSFHLSEECSNASIAGPRAIVMTGQLALWLGFVAILIIAYTVKDLGDVVAGQYGQPMASLCVQVLGKNAGLSMFILIIICQFFVGVGVTVASSRVIFSYSRDGVIPGSRWWSKVNSRTKTPVNSVWFVLALASITGLLGFASPVAINAVFSIGAIAQFVAFITPITLKTFFTADKFVPGPWNLGRWSYLNGVVATGFLIIILPALCFPTVKGHDLNELTMNYTVLIYGGIMLISVVYYAVSARKWFKGPRYNVEDSVDGVDADEKGQDHDSIQKGSVKNIDRLD